MMGDSPALIAIISGILGGGGAAIITAIASWRKGVREQDLTEDTTALQGYKDLAAEYKADLAAMKAEMKSMQAENAARFERIERELSTERSTRWAAVQYARELVALIRRLLPDAPIPPPHPSLADHIIVPSSPPEETP